MNIIEMHCFFSNDFDKEEQDKEIWIDGKLTYTIHKGLENDDANQVSPFEGKTALQTLHITDKGTIQHNHVDDSFYFLEKDHFATFIDGVLKSDHDTKIFNDYVLFAQRSVGYNIKNKNCLNVLRKKFPKGEQWSSSAKDDPEGFDYKIDDKYTVVVNRRWVGIKVDNERLLMLTQNALPEHMELTNKEREILTLIHPYF